MPATSLLRVIAAGAVLVVTATACTTQGVEPEIAMSGLPPAGTAAPGADPGAPDDSATESPNPAAEACAEVERTMNTATAPPTGAAGTEMAAQLDRIAESAPTTVAGPVAGLAEALRAAAVGSSGFDPGSRTAARFNTAFQEVGSVCAEARYGGSAQ